MGDNLRKMNFKGFTLIELLVVLAVFALLAALAYGSYSALYRLRAATASALTLLSGARTEAIKRNVGVALAPSEGGKALLAWADGNGNGALDGGEPVVLRASLEGYGARAELLGGPARFNALGRPQEAFALKVSASGRSALLCVGRAGRIVEAKDACP